MTACRSVHACDTPTPHYGICQQPELLLQYVFMDLETYEETRLGRDESWAKYLKEGFTVALVIWNDKVSWSQFVCHSTIGNDLWSNVNSKQGFAVSCTSALQLVLSF